MHEEAVLRIPDQHCRPAEEGRVDRCDDGDALDHRLQAAGHQGGDREDPRGKLWSYSEQAGRIRPGQRGGAAGSPREAHLVWDYRGIPAFFWRAGPGRAAGDGSGAGGGF